MASCNSPDHAYLFAVEWGKAGGRGGGRTLRSKGGTGPSDSGEISVRGRLERAGGAGVSCGHIPSDLNNARPLHQQEIVRALGVVQRDPRLEITNGGGY